ncbi:hypothetical protein [Sphingomonas sp. G-3-2-10]|uniref:hypothetical protein n=1 Tax=Sphingomonas sp. G-3-2-10 TaxID=2728838 RepID=UPI00146D28F4|nr:hypothetical protein [Sphingomonas sp. G-3-2-10]NML05146.1 hypothetical protein [Sphingomonas sp. G-3-2-10]
MKKLLLSAAIATAALSGALTATSASAQPYTYSGPAPGEEEYYDDQGQDGYYDDGGYERSRTEVRVEYREGYRDNGRYRPGDYYRGDGQGSLNGYRGDRRRYYRNNERCSGTTGAIVGGLLGAVIGGEAGRGGYYNRRSGTGTILGAGAGALIGSEIDRSNCREDYRDGYRGGYRR